MSKLLIQANFYQFAWYKKSRAGHFFWVESFVSDPGRRALLFDLDQAIQGVTPLMQADDPNLLKLTAVYHNLLRGWSRT